MCLNKIARIMVFLITTISFGRKIFGAAEPCPVGITPIETIEQALDELDIADEETLVCWDIDFTLLKPNSILGKVFFGARVDHADSGFVQKYTNILKTELSAEKIRLLEKNLRKYDLVESRVTRVIDGLASRNVKMIALSNSLETDKHSWRYEELLTLGVDFSNSFPDVDDLVLNKAAAIYDTDLFAGGFALKSPRFCKGTLLTNRVHKGKSLAEFILEVGWWPKKIIMFDDNCEYLIGIRDEMAKLDIPCSCYWYKAGTKPIKIDREVLLVQLFFLLDRDKYLPEQEVKKMDLALKDVLADQMTDKYFSDEKTV